MKKNKKRKKIKKRKVKYGRVFLFLLIVSLIFYLILQVFNFPIKNIYVYNNKSLNDQEIIDIAGISNYPSIFSVSTLQMEKKLEKNIYIKKATIKKRKLSEVDIYIEENYCLYYDSSKNVSILSDKIEDKSVLDCPILINYVTDKLYDDFFKAMSNIDRDIIERISEIKYDPNSVDEERFLFTMNDGNYVYLTLMHFEKINNYVNIIKNFEQKKGILYLDSGEYFKVFE